jgi:hypothetical protein
MRRPRMRPAKPNQNSMGSYGVLPVRLEAPDTRAQIPPEL